jgi:hypothetical protein
MKSGYFFNIWLVDVFSYNNLLSSNVPFSVQSFLSLNVSNLTHVAYGKTLWICPSILPQFPLLHNRTLKEENGIIQPLTINDLTLHVEHMSGDIVQKDINWRKIPLGHWWSWQ